LPWLIFNLPDTTFLHSSATWLMGIVPQTCATSDLELSIAPPDYPIWVEFCLQSTSRHW